MIEYVSLRKGEARLYFSSTAERELFLRGMNGVEGVERVEYKENFQGLVV